MHISGTRTFMQYRHEPDRMKKHHKDNSESDFRAVLDAETKKMESTKRPEDVIPYIWEIFLHIKNHLYFTSK